jgi:hypothetical protein
MPGALTYGILLVWSVLSFGIVLGSLIGSGKTNWWYFVLVLCPDPFFFFGKRIDA